MRVRRAIGCALAMVMAAGINSAFAQDSKATEIIARTRKALGGAKLETLKTFSMEAAVQRNVGQVQMNGDLEIALELPDKYMKSETPRGGMSITMNSGFNGDRAVIPAGASMAGGGGMMIRMGPGGMMTDAPKLTDEERAQLNTTLLRNARVEISRLMLGWFGTAHPALGAQYAYAGEAESPDGKAHVIDVKDAAGFEARLFIDQNNYLPLMVTYKGRQPRMMTTRGTTAQPAQGAPASGSGQQVRPLTDEERRKLQDDAEQRIRREAADQPLVEFSMFFEDWREIDGLTFPHVMRRAVAGETNEEWTVAKVRVNPKIDAKTFAIGGK